MSNATGVRNGVPYITVNSASVAAGASVVVNLVFSNPSKGPMATPPPFLPAPSKDHDYV